MKHRYTIRRSDGCRPLGASERALGPVWALQRTPDPCEHVLDPRTTEEAELDLVRAVANARTSVGDALETIRSMLGES